MLVCNHHAATGNIKALHAVTGTSAFQSDKVTAQNIEILKYHSCTTRNTGERIFRHPHTQSEFICQAVRQSLQQTAATRKTDTDIHQVCDNLRRYFIQGITDRIHDYLHSAGQRLPHFNRRDFNALGQSGDKVSCRVLPWFFPAEADRQTRSSI